MSYLLDALKKSESESGKKTPSPDIMAANQHYMPTTVNPSSGGIDWFKIVAIVAILLLAVAVAFLLGRESLYSTSQIDPVTATTKSNAPEQSSTSAVVTPSMVSNPVMTAQPVVKARPEQTQRAYSQVVKPRAQPQAGSVITGFDDPESFNQRYQQDKKTSPAESDFDDEQGMKLTGRSKLLANDSNEASNDLLKRFEQAVAATKDLSDKDIVELHKDALLPSISDMPMAVQDKVPSLQYQIHIYSSKASDRWVKINDKVIREGELLGPNVSVSEIRQKVLVLKHKQDEFTLKALTNW